MRVVLDTNILVSALLVQLGNPGIIYRAWHERHYSLLTCAEQMDELRATLQKPALAERIKPYRAGRLVSEIKERAAIISSPPLVKRSPDPTDDFLLSLCEAGKADYLVTGDKGGLLSLARHKRRELFPQGNLHGCSPELAGSCARPAQFVPLTGLYFFRFSSFSKK